jgi:hypothetical protein
MARERTPEGKRVVIPVRVSEPKAEAIDKARGDTPRSVWVERAIDAFLVAARNAKPRRSSAKDPRREPESASDIAAAIFRRTNGGQ